MLFQVCIQHLSNWNDTRPEEISAFSRVAWDAVLYHQEIYERSAFKFPYVGQLQHAFWVGEPRIGEPEFIPPFI